MINPMDLSEKIILVTGASSGIGRVTAIQLSKLGGRVVLVARNKVKLNETVDMMEGRGHTVYSFDLIQIEKIEELIRQIILENGALNGLVHCAGIAPMRPLGLTKADFLHNVMLINFYSFVELVRCVSKKKNYQIGASFIGISSTSSRIGDKSKVAYCASKAALDSAVRCMAKELAEKGIRVNTVMPGFVKTGMYTDYMREYSNASDAKKILARQYIGITEPEEIANAVAYLLSDSAKTITGSSFLVDGGSLS